MSLGLLGKKLGMTRIYTDKGEAVAVTVVDVSDNDVLQVKSAETDGYTAVQVGYQNGKAKHLTKQEQGHCQKHGAPLKRHVREFRLADGAEAPAAGSPLTADLFQKGPVRRHHRRHQGQGLSGRRQALRLRRPARLARVDDAPPDRIHRVPPHARPRLEEPEDARPHGPGAAAPSRTSRSSRARTDDNVILIRGSFPGAKGDLVVIRPAKKKPAPAA